MLCIKRPYIKGHVAVNVSRRKRRGLVVVEITICIHGHSQPLGRTLQGRDGGWEGGLWGFHGGRMNSFPFPRLGCLLPPRVDSYYTTGSDYYTSRRVGEGRGLRHVASKVEPSTIFPVVRPSLDEISDPAEKWSMMGLFACAVVSLTHKRWRTGRCCWDIYDRGLSHINDIKTLPTAANGTAGTRAGLLSESRGSRDNAVSKQYTTEYVFLQSDA